MINECHSTPSSEYFDFYSFSLRIGKICLIYLNFALLNALKGIVDEIFYKFEQGS